jgi:hypothetical protein
MKKTIIKATGYVYEHLTNVLSKGLQTAIPKDVLEKEGLDVDELGEYFYTRRGPYGLIHFLGIRKML